MPSWRSTPATEWIFVTSSASSKLRSGKIVGTARASMVFPEPGGPMSSPLCPPAASTTGISKSSSRGRTSFSVWGALPRPGPMRAASQERAFSRISPYRSGRGKAFGCLVGQVVRRRRGQAAPAVVRQVLLEQLAEQ